MSNGHLSLAGSVGALFDPELPRVRMVGQIAAFHIFELLFSTESAHSSDWFSMAVLTHLAPARAVWGTNLPSRVSGSFVER